MRQGSVSPCLIDWRFKFLQTQRFDTAAGRFSRADGARGRIALKGKAYETGWDTKVQQRQMRWTR